MPTRTDQSGTGHSSMDRIICGLLHHSRKLPYRQIQLSDEDDTGHDGFHTRFKPRQNQEGSKVPLQTGHVHPHIPVLVTAIGVYGPISSCTHVSEEVLKKNKVTHLEVLVDFG